MDYKNTTNLSGEDLKRENQKAINKTEKVFQLFRNNPQTLYSPFDVQNELFGHQDAATIVSVRRSITNLTSLGKLIKTDKSKVSRLGHKNNLWRFNPGYREDTYYGNKISIKSLLLKIVDENYGVVPELIAAITPNICFYSKFQKDGESRVVYIKPKMDINTKTPYAWPSEEDEDYRKGDNTMFSPIDKYEVVYDPVREPAGTSFIFIDPKAGLVKMEKSDVLDGPIYYYINKEGWVYILRDGSYHAKNSFRTFHYEDRVIMTGYYPLVYSVAQAKKHLTPLPMVLVVDNNTYGYSGEKNIYVSMDKDNMGELTMDIHQALPYIFKD